MSGDYPRETLEFQPISVTVGGLEVLANVEVACIPYGARPTAWTQPATLDGRLGVMVDRFTPAIWAVWARVTSTPEAVIIHCGTFRVT